MCKGEDCKLKESCYRFTAIPNEYSQSYFIVVPIDKNGYCDEYWNKGVGNEY